MPAEMPDLSQTSEATKRPANPAFANFFSVQIEPEQLVQCPWRCRLRLHRWSRWGGVLERTRKLLVAGLHSRINERYQKRECLDCGMRQERPLL